MIDAREFIDFKAIPNSGRETGNRAEKFPSRPARQDGGRQAAKASAVFGDVRTAGEQSESHACIHHVRSGSDITVTVSRGKATVAERTRRTLAWRLP